MARDPFVLETSPLKLIGPARSGMQVTPDDDNDIPIMPRMLYIGTGGNITLRMADDSANIVIRNLPDGSRLDIRPSRILATGTTASDIVAFH